MSVHVTYYVSSVVPIAGYLKICVPQVKTKQNKPIYSWLRKAQGIWGVRVKGTQFGGGKSGRAQQRNSDHNGLGCEGGWREFQR